MLIELLLNDNDQFIIVQGAGNGYDNSLTAGYDAAYSGFYSGITEELYNDLLNDKADKLNDLFGINYSSADEHILIVGACKHEANESKEYGIHNGSGRIIYCSGHTKNSLC